MGECFRRARGSQQVVPPSTEMSTCFTPPAPAAQAKPVEEVTAGSAAVAVHGDLQRVDRLVGDHRLEVVERSVGEIHPELLPTKP